MKATDLIVRYDGDPRALDETVQALPGVLGAVVQGAAAPDYDRTEDGHLRIRIFSDAAMASFMLTSQGYVREVIREEQV